MQQLPDRKALVRLWRPDRGLPGGGGGLSPGEQEALLRGNAERLYRCENPAQEFLPRIPHVAFEIRHSAL